MDKKPATLNPPQFFDRIFKRIMHLSRPTLVHFINALFDKNYPPDTPLTLSSSEYTTDSLKQVRADTVIQVNHSDTYIIEVQMTNDEDMALRIFNYSYQEGLKTKTTEGTMIHLKLIPAIVIYLEPTETTPHELFFKITGFDGVDHIFRFPVLRLLDYSIKEIEERKLSILLPFYLLKLRKRVQGMRSREEREELSGEMKGMIEELIETIERSEVKGVMSKGDKRQVMGLMGKVYDRLYKTYTEFKESNDMVDDMILTAIDEAEMRAKQRTEQRKSKEFAQYLIKKGWDSKEIAEATKLDLPTVESFMGQFSSQEGEGVRHFNDADDMVLPVADEDEAELKARQDEKVHIAQSLIEMGLTNEQIAKATKLDLSTVELLYGAAQS